MEKDFVFGFQQQLHSSSQNLSLLHFPFDNHHSNAGPGFLNPNSGEDSTLRTASFEPISQFQHSRISELHDSRNGSYHVPSFHQTFNPSLYTGSKEKFHLGQFDLGQCGESRTTGSVPDQRKFLVFDQSGDTTTLIYSSGVQTLVEHGSYWMPNPLTPFNLGQDEFKSSTRPSRLSTADESLEANSRDVTGDEMREDTEELNALLCSDTETDFSADEETSTGHSPSTMTGNSVHYPVEEHGEEVNSLVGPTKKRKCLDGGYVLSDRLTANSRKSFTSFASDNDAESHCGDNIKPCNEELESWSSNKRLKKEKIRKTLNILQSLIPNVNGNDAIVVIDEAIRYLKLLKAEAVALGLSSI